MDPNVLNTQLEKASDVEVFQDILERPDLTHDEKLKVWHTAAEKGWSECVEVFIQRYPDIVQGREGAQAWVTMAGNGHTDCWMQLIHEYLSNKELEPLWKSALDMCVDDAAFGHHASVHALSYVTKEIAPFEAPTTRVHSEITALYIPLLHMSSYNELLGEDVLRGLVAQTIKSLSQKPFDPTSLFNLS